MARQRDDQFFGVSDAFVRLGWRGRATVGSPGRAQLGDRDQGISELIWDVLARAGWLGQRSGVRPAIVVCVRVPAARRSREGTAARTVLRPGGPRREGELGRIGDDGAAYQRYEGPLHVRAVPGIWLIDSERRPEDFDYLEDMLYTAALRTEWLSRDPQGPPLAEVPDVEILIGVTPRDSSGWD
jgi:hypothetical protein